MLCRRKGCLITYSRTVIIPEDNAKDLEEIDQNVRKALNFITVRHADSVISAALNFASLQTQAPEQETRPDAVIPAPHRKKNKEGIRQ